jgi:hypothetical protein
MVFVAGRLESIPSLTQTILVKLIVPVRSFRLLAELRHDPFMGQTILRRPPMASLVPGARIGW